MTEPTTEPGRALLEGMLKFSPGEDPAIPRVREGLRRDIRAIEGTARRDGASAALDKAKAAVEGIRAPGLATGDVVVAEILTEIRRLRAAIESAR